MYQKLPGSNLYSVSGKMLLAGRINKREGMGCAEDVHEEHIPI